jgi:hypothetical protein
MNKFEDNPFDGELEVIATLRDRAIEASINHVQVRDELFSALEYGLKTGISIDALSDASGLTTEQIRGIASTLVIS